MMRCLYVSVFFLLGLSACSADDSELVIANKKDFDLFCEQFKIITESADFSSSTSEERAAKLDAVLTEKIEPSGNAYIVWSAIRNAPPSERYSLYKDAAASTGYAEWTCPAAELHGSEIGSSHN